LAVKPECVSLSVEFFKHARIEAGLAEAAIFVATQIGHHVRGLREKAKKAQRFSSTPIRDRGMLLGQRGSKL
jgi:hypothetical protein